MPELPRDVVIDMQRSIGNRAVTAVIEGEPPPPTIALARAPKGSTKMPPAARRHGEPVGTWVAPFGLGIARDCGSALVIGLRLRAKLLDGMIRKELTEALRGLGEDPDRPLTRAQALALAALGARATT